MSIAGVLNKMTTLIEKKYIIFAFICATLFNLGYWTKTLGWFNTIIFIVPQPFLPIQLFLSSVLMWILLPLVIVALFPIYIIFHNNFSNLQRWERYAIYFARALLIVMSLSVYLLKSGHWYLAAFTFFIWISLGIYLHLTAAMFSEIPFISDEKNVNLGTLLAFLLAIYFAGGHLSSYVSKHYSIIYKNNQENKITYLGMVSDKFVGKSGDTLYFLSEARISKNTQ